MTIPNRAEPLITSASSEKIDIILQQQGRYGRWDDFFIFDGAPTTEEATTILKAMNDAFPGAAHRIAKLATRVRKELYLVDPEELRS